MRGVWPRNILILYVQFLNIMMRDVRILNIKIWYVQLLKGLVNLRILSVGLVKD